MESASAFKRPKPGDNEENLLRMQEAFLKNKEQLSTKFVNLSNQFKQQSNSEKTKIESQFSKLKKLKTQQEKVSTSQNPHEILNCNVTEKIHTDFTREEKNIHDHVHNIPIDPSNVILGNIVEKHFDLSNIQLNFTKELYLNSLETGFPKVFVSNDYLKKSKKSLFSQKISEKVYHNEYTNKDSHKRSNTNHFPEKSSLIEDQWRAEIHKENLEKLKEMGEEEILKEKKMLQASLSPELIEFIKRRKEKKKESNMVINKSMENMQSVESGESNDHSNDNGKMEVDHLENSQPIPKPCMDIVEQAKVQGWLHLDKVETEKLEWMQDIDTEKKNEPYPDQPYNARFDFNGLLLPYKDSNLSVDEGLHHHGEEPERPGYSLQELLQLSRSAAQQQRCTALTTLANIMEKSRKGWYDKVLQPPPLVALSQRNILLLLRFSLDDTSVAVVTATLQAIRAFLVSEADEVCLDRMYGWNEYLEPLLSAPPTDVKDESTLKDHELIQLDAIAALLRSDILLRIRYILNEMHPPPIGVTCALEILIRLTRHSHVTALNIASTPYLLNTIVTNFIPLSTNRLVAQNITDVYGVPVTAAVRLCRILVCYGKRAIAEKLIALKILQPLISYVSSTSETGKEGIHLSIESLRLWKILLHHKVALDSVEGARLMLLSQLQLLLCNLDIDSSSEVLCEYATSLIAVACTINSLKENISMLLSKWSTQLSSVTTPTWCSLKLISQAFLVTLNVNAFKTSWISKPYIFSTLCSVSNLLSTCTSAINREPSCLPNLGVLTEDGQLQPIVSRESSISFLRTVLNIFYDEKIQTELQRIFNQTEFLKYLEKLAFTSWSLERSWYTRLEQSFLVTVVKTTSFLDKTLNSSIKYNVWKICVKLVSSLPADNSSVVEDMIRIAFSSEKLNVEVITTKLAQFKLDTYNEQTKFNGKNAIAELYKKYITSSSNWEQAAMPKDWLYLPLVHVYTKCRNNETCTEEDKRNILAVLNLQIILPDLTEKLSPTLRFSRLVLPYLCDTIYLNNDVSSLLTKVISDLAIKYYRKFDFSKDIPGLNSFVDLFTAMCEHFCSTSYGDYGFAMTLLIPLAQRHDVHYRKLLWSEHAGALRYLKLPMEKLIIPLKEYLYPNEQDVSLIKSYITALVRNIIRQEWCPIPYMIAVHHSAMYLKGTTKLAVRMRTQVQMLSNKVLSNVLLNYEPPNIQ